MLKANSRFFLFFLFLQASVYAQTQETILVRDFEAWTSVGIAYKPNKKWSFELLERLQLKDNASVVSGYFTEIESAYAITKHWKIGAGFRYIRNNDTRGKIQGYENFHRYHFDLKYQHDIKRFTLGYRLRYQTKSELGVTGADLDIPNQNIRLKIEVDYNIKKSNYTPTLGVDFFNAILESGGIVFSKYRIISGVDYQFKTAGKVGLFYLIDQQVHVDYPKTTHVLSLKYMYTFK